jgi:hypothetical protein
MDYTVLIRFLERTENFSFFHSRPEQFTHPTFPKSVHNMMLKHWFNFTLIPDKMTALIGHNFDKNCWPYGPIPCPRFLKFKWFIVSGLILGSNTLEGLTNDSKVDLILEIITTEINRHRHSIWFVISCTWHSIWWRHAVLWYKTARSLKLLIGWTKDGASCLTRPKSN